MALVSKLKPQDFYWRNFNAQKNVLAILNSEANTDKDIANKISYPCTNECAKKEKNMTVLELCYAWGVTNDYEQLLT